MQRQKPRIRDYKLFYTRLVLRGDNTILDLYLMVQH